MKTFAVFLTDGKEQCGSDAWFRLDSRNTIDTQKQDARNRIHQLRHVKQYNGFKIVRGDINRDQKVIYVEEKL